MIRYLSKFYGDENPTKTEEKPPETPKVFTQDEVNALLAENKRNLKKQIEDLQKTAGDAKTFQTKIKELNDALLTKEELAKQEAERLKNEYENQLKNSIEEKAAWENRYKSQAFDVALSRADSKHKLFDADQFAHILRPLSEVVPDTDKDGKPNGAFKVLTKVEIDGKPLVLPLEEAVGKLREAGKYPNQFKVNGVGGTGTTTLNNGTGPVVPGEVKPQDTEGFMAMYKKMKAEGKLRS